MTRNHADVALVSEDTGYACRLATTFPEAMLPSAGDDASGLVSLSGAVLPFSVNVRPLRIDHGDGRSSIIVVMKSWRPPCEVGAGKAPASIFAF